jgi:aryl-alcohol dehydrogenase-like predicted oxidoreductase
MDTVALAKTGVDLSAFCMGTMNMGSRVDGKTSMAILDAYCDVGGSFIDTANVYSHWNPQGRMGDSEELLGEWMRQRGNRSGLFVATKVGLQKPDGAAGLKARQIEAECEDSLRRLGVETIDLYYSHLDDRNTPLAESLQAFDRLVQAGKVRFIGASNHLTWRFVEARWLSRSNGWASYMCIQQRYSYLRQNPAATLAPNANASFDLLDYCKSEQIPLVGFSPLAKGAIANPAKELQEQYHGRDTEARLAMLKTIAAETGSSLNQVVLAWIAQSPAPIIPLFSASSLEQMQDNLGALDLHLDEEQMQRLTEAKGV